MGVLIDAFSLYFRREDLGTFEWDEARRSKEGIKDYLGHGGERINVAKFKRILDMRGFFLERVGLEMRSSFDVSNLGGIRAGGGEVEEKRWEMGKMVFSRSAFAAGGAFSTSVVTGVDGCLVLGFTLREGVVSKELMEIVTEMVRCEMERIALEQ